MNHPRLKLALRRAKNAISGFRNYFRPERKHYLLAAFLDLALMVLVLGLTLQPVKDLLSPSGLKPLTQEKSKYEVFGFAPHWTFARLDNVNFDVLTTLAYFDIPVNANGSIDKGSPGYQKFKSEDATRLFKRAHDAQTRVVATFTQMDNPTILRFLDSEEAQKTAIENSVSEVKDRGIDGANIDFEYIGDPGADYRAKFTKFATDFTHKMHSEIPSSKVTVSVYASAAVNPKVYDIKALGTVVDGVFMMAYDFAVHGSDVAMPTAPLYGHETGQYWYDISTAVEDFLASMPSEKLILGVPWYGYNYAVYSPGVKAETHRGYYVRSYVKTKKGKKLVSRLVKPKSAAQTYQITEDEITADLPGFSTGWDEQGQVGYKAYFSNSDNTYRQIFIEDEKSLGIKYDFAKEKKLGGVGMWALGFDDGKPEMWTLLREKFGNKKVALND